MVARQPNALESHSRVRLSRRRRAIGWDCVVPTTCIAPRAGFEGPDRRMPHGKYDWMEVGAIRLWAGFRASGSLCTLGR
jgi:hypothetical protein